MAFCTLQLARDSYNCRLTIYFTCRCTCGNCSRELLTNISECYCCKEIEGCCEALTSDIVREDLVEGQELACITQHPGFRPVCLEKWSLRLAASKYKTRDRQRYKKTGSEERSVEDINLHLVVSSAQNNKLTNTCFYLQSISDIKIATFFCCL